MGPHPHVPIEALQGVVKHHCKPAWVQVGLPGDVVVGSTWSFCENWDEKATYMEKGSMKLNVSGLFSKCSAFGHEAMLASAHKVKCEVDAQALVKKALSPLPKEDPGVGAFETPKCKAARSRPMPGRAPSSSKRPKLEDWGQPTSFMNLFFCRGVQLTGAPDPGQMLRYRGNR